MSLLTVENLSVTFATADGDVQAVREVSFTLHSKSLLGVVGESGSGKSQTLMAIAGLLPNNARVTGKIWFNGQDLLTMPVRARRRLLGRDVAVVFQDAMTALNPYLTVEAQMSEGLRFHEKLSASKARARCLAMLEAVRINDGQRRLKQYPHELSGGMRQRVLIATALLSQPTLLLADEPTTALDVTVQADILNLLTDLPKRFGTAVMFVTHDLGVIAQLCERALVMYGGQILEEAAVTPLFETPYHPYTRALLNALPQRQLGQTRLTAIEGSPPSAHAHYQGCPFAPRCAFFENQCKQPLTVHTIYESHTHACHRDQPWQ